MIWSWVNVRMNEQLKQGLHVAGVTLQIVPKPMESHRFQAYMYIYIYILQVSEHHPQVVDVYIYTYVYVSGLVACGQVACGLVAYGTAYGCSPVACRNGCLWLACL